MDNFASALCVPYLKRTFRIKVHQAVLSVSLMRTVPLFFRKGYGTVGTLGGWNTNKSYPQVAGYDLN